MTDPGWLAVVPTAVVLATAVGCRSTLPALALGAVAGHLLLDGAGCLGGLAAALSRQLREESVAWVVLVCTLLGCLVEVLVRAGGLAAFARLVGDRVRSGPVALLVAWALGLAVFIDDYLNALLVGHAMRPVADRFNVPRERLAYVIDSTAAPVCILVPLSTWAVYVAALLESTGAAPAGGGLAAYCRLIPLLLYGWAAVLLVPLVVTGRIPSWGAMRAADDRTAGGGPVAPPGSPPALEAPIAAGGGLADFVVPVVVLCAATVLSGNDALAGTVWALAAALVQQGAVRRRFTARSLADACCAGAATMIPAVATILLAFVLKDVNDRLRLTQWVIDGLGPWLDGRLLPAAVFVSLSAVTFATGSFWGTYAVALPIVMPLATTLGAHPALTLAAVVSAGAFGSHACFFGDTTVLSSQAAGCENLAHAWSQMPYSLLAAALATAGYLVLGAAWSA